MYTLPLLAQKNNEMIKNKHKIQVQTQDTTTFFPRKPKNPIKKWRFFPLAKSQTM